MSSNNVIEAFRIGTFLDEVQTRKWERSQETIKKLRRNLKEATDYIRQQHLFPSNGTCDCKWCEGTVPDDATASEKQGAGR